MKCKFSWLHDSIIQLHVSRSAQAAFGTRLLRLRASARQSPQTPIQFQEKGSAAKYPLRDAGAALAPPATRAAFLTIIRGLRNIQRGEILREHDAIPPAANNPVLAAGDGYPHRPSVPPAPAVRHRWWQAHRSWPGQKRKMRGPANTGTTNPGHHPPRLHRRPQGTPATAPDAAATTHADAVRQDRGYRARVA